MPAFTAVAYVPALILERPLFLRERNDGLYRVITYLSFKISAVRCWEPLCRRDLCSQQCPINS